MIYVLRNGGVDDGAATWKGVVSFADCKDHWAAGYIAYCEAYGLINGRTETVFDPEANISGIELAKMILTTAGYKTDVEGFTGNGWEKNVVAEANAVNLFAGVEFAISDAAPRQWAAVMFKNAFEVTVPTYIGDYRVDGIISGVKAQKVSEKYLNFVQTTDYVNANDVWAITGTKAEAGKTVLATDGVVDFDVADALVGQQVTVTKVGTKVLSIVATGKSNIGELTIGAKATSGENKDKYPIMVNGKVMKYLAGDHNLGTLPKVNAGVVDSKYADVNTVKELKDAIEGKTTSLKVIGVDKDGDKTVEKIMLVEDQYVAISNVVTSGTNKGQFEIGALTVKKDGKIGTEAADIKVEAVDGLVVKVTKDWMTGKITVAGAEGVSVAKFTGISGDNYIFEGEKYFVSDNAIADTETWLKNTANLKTETLIYTDGKYIVSAAKFVEKPDDDDTTVTELPEYLAYVVDAGTVVTKTPKKDKWGNVIDGQFDTTTTYMLEVLMKGESATKKVEYYVDKSGETKVATAGGYTAAEAFATGAAIKGGIFEYGKIGEKIYLKKALGEVENVKFYPGATDKIAEVDNTAGATVTYNASSKLLTGITNTFILGTDDTLVFAKYTEGTKAPVYKFVKLSELANYDVVENSLKLIAAKNGTIGTALLAKVELNKKTETPAGDKTLEPIYLVTKEIEYTVEGDKVYQVFEAIDMTTAGAAKQYKAKLETTGLTIAKGTMYKLTVDKDGLVTVAAAQPAMKTGSIKAEAAGLLIVSYDKDGTGKKDYAVETKGEAAKTYFATGSKIIVKNGDTYTLGTVDQLHEAKKVNSAHKDNFKYVVDGGKFTYIIIDADGDITE
jgi:hypothetical protein